MSRDALVVGISTYQYLPALNAPAQDAEAIASQLETYGDFRVARLPEIVQSDKLRVGVKTPVTLMELEAALVKLFKPKGNNIPHTALFYYSGHGLQKEAGIHEGYLATSDANPAANFFGLSLFWLRRLLQESPVRQRIVLLDCCHSGEILNFLEADPGARSGTDRLFMAASREYESAYESLTGHYSVFTQALLEGLDPRRMPNGTITNYALTDWVSTALKGESQQPLFENSGSEIILTQCQGPLTVINSSVSEEVCPYRGLEPFDETHADYFFGRETLTDQLLDKLKSSQFLAVVGASGSGKSSLVRAGLVHKLQRGQTISGSNHWQTRIITPTDYPFKSLANAFVNPDATPVDHAEQLRRAELLLQEGGSGFSQLIRASLMSEANKHARLVLIIDQFEEVFTLCQGPHAEHERHRFFNCLLTGLREVGDRFSVVIVLRADFFSKCSFYRALSEQMEANLVMVTPLTYEQIKASILKPAEKVGLVCEPNLVYNILLDIVGAPGELPLLQYTLLELWHRRQQDPNGGSSRLTLDAYTELGGVRGTLQKRADELFYSLSLEEQQIAKRIFIALTQLGEGTEDTRRRVLKSELVSPQFSADLVEQVLEKLIRAKLVITNQIAPANGHQERIDQRLANMSTALRLAQVARRKSPALPETPSQKLALTAKRSLLDRGYDVNIARISHNVNLEQFQAVSGRGTESCQETVDIAHEALIRNWSLLRSWLDENREMLRRQRQIERSAREWNAAHQPHSPEYLLHGNRLLDAEDYLNHYPNELSALAQRFISVSQEESRRTRREVRLLQFTIPSALFFALGITFFQYQVALHNQAEKDYQLRVSTSRQWSAIAQSILQEPDGDPNTALLISRLAAERGHTYEAEASLRAALQKLRLQATFNAGEKPLRHLALSPDRNWLATLEQGNTIRLWSLAAQKVKRVLQWHEGEKQGNPPGGEQAGDGGGPKSSPDGGMITFSADGQALVAVAHRADQVKIWSVESGKQQFQLEGFQAPITHVALSPDGKWIAAASEDRTIQVWQMQTGQLQSQFSQPIAPSSLTFSPDSKLLLAASGNRTTLWQVDTRQSRRTLTAASPIQRAAFSADGRWIAMLLQDGKVQVQEVATGQVRQTLAIAPAGQEGILTPAAQLVFSPNGQVLAVNTGKGQLWAWNLESGQQWHIEPPPAKIQISNQGGLGAIAFSPDSRYLVTSQQQQGEDQVIYVATLYDSRTGQEIGTLRGHTAPITAIQFTEDGSLIATSSLDGTVRLWSAEVGGELPSLKMADRPIQWLAFQQQNNASHEPVGSTQSKSVLHGPVLNGIVTVATNGALQRWDLVQPLTISAAINSSIGNARLERAFSPTSVRNNIVRTLNQIRQEVGNLGTELQMHLSSLMRVGVPVSSPIQNSQSLAKANGNYLSNLGAIAATTRQSQVLTNLTDKLLPQSKLASVAFSADGQRLATSDSTGKVAVWQINSDQTLNRIGELQAVQVVAKPVPTQARQQSSGGNAIRYLAFSPDGQMLLGVGVDWTLHLWEVRSGKLLQSLTGHEAFVEQAQFSADGRRIISASWDRTARIWEVESGQLKLTLTHKDGVTSAHFGPDGQQVVTTSLDGTAKVYDSYTGALQVILAGHRGAVLDAAFSPDGQTIATGSTDGIVRLWDASTGVEKATLRPTRPSAQADSIKQISFSPDGHHLVALTSSGQLQLWIASWPGLLEVARDRSLRQLKPEECLRYLRLAPNVCPTLTLNSNVR
ncbi:nSTAND1 domain-containing NTPase [Leptodesmis sichuanensis]|uniref:nSTAND1 domain-containing NTPase n=1 Tax=Leptodesmis sichuanensis TaxID=2906798 RepID=UPI001F3FC7FF|nr:caspase family protein [Leptodesmis sichuanensis]UIE38939.1 caspase family protein [Leptodesmis sichuanensis A121]